MNLLAFFTAKSDAANIAKERLQLSVATKGNSNFENLILSLKDDIASILHRYPVLDPNQLSIRHDRKKDRLKLEVPVNEGPLE